MGRRFARLAARQHANLTASPSESSAAHWARRILIAVLAFDGVLSAVAGALFLPLYVGSVPLPVSSLLSGLLNAALVWATLQWTSVTRLAGAPLWAFLATVVVMTFGGPGDDVVFDANSPVRFILFVVLGAAPPAFLLWRNQARTISPSRPL
jgi:hypothetical protein